MFVDIGCSTRITRVLRGRLKANIECLGIFRGSWTDGHLAKSVTAPVVCPKANHGVCDMGLCGYA